MKSQPQKNCPQCEKEVALLNSGRLICRYCGWTNKKKPFSKETVNQPKIEQFSNQEITVESTTNQTNSKFSNLTKLTPKQYLTALVVAILAFGGIVSFALSKNDPYICSKKQREEIIAKLNPLIDDWDDANSLASSTSRINLAVPVSNLQSVQKQIRNLDSPKCAKPVIDQALDMTEETINIYLLFMQDEEDFVVNSKLSNVRGSQSLFIKYYSRLNKGESTEPTKVLQEVSEDSQNLLENIKK